MIDEKDETKKNRKLKRLGYWVTKGKPTGDINSQNELFQDSY